MAYQHIDFSFDLDQGLKIAGLVLNNFNQPLNISLESLVCHDHSDVMLDQKSQPDC